MADVTSELLEAKISEVKARLDAMDKAISLARKEMDTRLQHLNELRREVMDDRRIYVTNDVFLAKMEKIDQWKNSLWLSVFSVIVSLGAAVVVLIRLAT